MTPEELTQLASHQQSVLTRHDQTLSLHTQEMAEIRSTQQRTENILNANAEQLATLTAGLLELRNLVADYIQGRSR